MRPPTPPDAPLRIQQDLRLLFEAREACEQPHQILLAARATVLCGLPLRPVTCRSWIKEARLGADEKLIVTFCAIGEPLLPYGADRALFTWIQTRAYANDGLVSFDTLREFLDAFHLPADGRNYALFRERLERLQNVSVQIKHIHDGSVLTFNSHPISLAITPQDSAEMRSLLAEDGSAQESLLVQKPWGFLLNKTFWSYLRANPVPLPLPLMRIFHNRPKAWDLAAFVTYRCYCASTPSVIPWEGLRQVLGSQERKERQLRRTLVRDLAEIKTVLPDLPAFFLPGRQGLAVAPWRPQAQPEKLAV